MKWKRHEGNYSFISDDGNWIIESTELGGELAWAVFDASNGEALGHARSIAGCKLIVRELVDYMESV